LNHDFKPPDLATDVRCGALYELLYLGNPWLPIFCRRAFSVTASPTPLAADFEATLNRWLNVVGSLLVVTYSGLPLSIGFEVVVFFVNGDHLLRPSPAWTVAAQATSKAANAQHNNVFTVRTPCERPMDPKAEKRGGGLSQKGFATSRRVVRR
jgi:hypothetical protein